MQLAPRSKVSGVPGLLAFGHPSRNDRSAMRAVMVMFDTLCRHLLSAYGCDWTHTPNFARLASRTVRFDKAYVCSMPCMPARRELHTGRPNFLHRSWGPLEPFDDSMPEMLRRAGVHTHLATDHYHYFEDGGATYHPRYSTYEFFRGQEGDAWHGQVARPDIPETVTRRSDMDSLWLQDWKNRAQMRREEQMPQSRTFRAGLEFIRRNADHDRWFLQIETFDPHEPFFSPRRYKDHFAKHYDTYTGRHWDWPPYARRGTETDAEVEHLRYEYASLLAKCDAHLGDVLDTFDELDLWRDTMLIVCTDHGFLLGEHECFAKVWCPFYQEVAHVPLFIHDPRNPAPGQSRQALVQMIDFAPTLLEYFDVDRTPDMLGVPLRDTIARDAPTRDAALFGAHGGTVHVTDGRYVYFRAADPTAPLFDYTLMPTHMNRRFGPDQLKKTVGLAEPFGFTKGVRPMKIDRTGESWASRDPECRSHLLFDVERDPKQLAPIDDKAIEARMIDLLKCHMRRCEAPPEQFARLGLSA